MNHNAKISLVSLLVLGLFGCASLETNAFRVIAATATIVDGALSGWGEYVRSGKASAEEEAIVKQSYITYQASMRTAKAAVESYRATPDAAALSRTLDALDAAKNALIDAIYAFKK